MFRRKQRALHQFTIAISPGDAISDETFLMRDWLRSMGLQSDIYVEHIHPDYADEVLPYTSYRPRRRNELVILHYSIGSPLMDQLLSQSVRFLLIYHNLTPASFFKNISLEFAAKLEAGREALVAFADRSAYAFGDSDYSRQELVEAGFNNTQVLPIPLNEADYAYPDDVALVQKLQEIGPNLLFVGRVAPNKKQEDLIKLLYFYRRFEPTARLWLIGSLTQTHYVQWLQQLVENLGLQEHVFFAGHVTQQELATFYRHADIYVSMSEHEGFGKPLVESMYAELPILAYHSSAVPYTLGDAGILFHTKNYEALAEVVDLICHDTQLRTQMIEKQNVRLNQFLSSTIFTQWQKIIPQALENES